MKNLFKKFQDIMMAATFAEAGEWDTARAMTPDMKLQRGITWFDKVFMAVTFAESGLHDEAIRFSEPANVDCSDFNSAILEDMGLKGVRLV